MDIGALNVRVTFQKSETVSDKIGNRSNEWTDYYTCNATVSCESGSENTVAGVVMENVGINFTVRYCKAVEQITVTGYRIVFGGEIYNILAIDNFGFRKKAVKFKCEKVRR